MRTPSSPPDPPPPWSAASPPAPRFRRATTLAVVAALALVALPAVAWGADGSDFEALRTRGWAWAFLGVFGAGVLTSLTPCVYPMIGITVSIFGAREAGSRLRAFGLGAMYVLGMAVMYAALGVIFALTGRVTGAGHLLAEPLVVIPLVVLFVALAASMLGAFELRLPSSLQERLVRIGGKGTMGAFLMGLVGGLIAAPCTGPLLAGLLAFVATTRSLGLGMSLMVTYALGMGLLFLLIATFAMSLPKSGPWMEVVKAIGGVALLVAGAYFLRPIWPAFATLIGRSTPILVGGAAALAVGLLVVWAHIRLAGGVARATKLAGVALATAGGIAVMSWTQTPGTELAWRTDVDAALADARAAGKPVLIDFAAEWCKPCKVYETEVFAHPDVHAFLSERYVSIKIDVTEGTDEDLAAQERWDAASLPTVILLGPDGAERRRFQGDAPAAAKFLDAARAVVSPGSPSHARRQ